MPDYPILCRSMIIIGPILCRGVKSNQNYGPKDVLIIVSMEGPDIVPRKKGELTKKDMNRLTSQGIPQESWHDDAKLMEARFKKFSKRFKNVENTHGSKRGYILDKITTTQLNQEV